MPYAHPELVSFCPPYAAESLRCEYGLTEPKSFHKNVESPDFWGCMMSSLHTVVIECKRSRADLHRDLDKMARRHAAPLGHLRYLAGEPNVVRREDAEERRWGLLHAIDGRLVEVVPSGVWKLEPFAWQVSFELLVRSLRRGRLVKPPTDTRNASRVGPPRPTASPARSMASLRLRRDVHALLTSAGAGALVSAAEIKRALSLPGSAKKVAERIAPWAKQEGIDVVKDGARTSFVLASAVTNEGDRK